MTDSEAPTNPNIDFKPEESWDYLLGAVQRIEAQLASEEPPPWAKKLLSAISHLEHEVKQIKTTCASRHPSNGYKLPQI